MSVELISRVLDTTPINRLRPDILYQIFTIHRNIWIIALSNPSEKVTYDWTTVAHVCRYWRTAALDFPSLWSQLLNFSSIERTRAFLDRSKDAPLRVTCGISYPFSNSEYRDGRLDCLMEALEHSSRIKELEMSIYFPSRHLEKLERIRNILGGALPQLQTAKVHFTYDRGAQINKLVPLDFNANVPLTHLSLSDFIWRTNSVIPTNLLELRLMEIQGLPFVSFVESLLSSPNLKVLRISQIRWIMGATTSELAFLRSTTIYLPKLSYLSIAYHMRNTPGNEDILYLLDIPITTQWYWICSSDDWQPLLASDAFYRFASESLICKHLVIDVQMMSITIEAQNAVPGSNESQSLLAGVRFSFTGGPPTTSQVVARIASIIEACRWKRATSVELSLHLNPDQMAEEDWNALLLALSPVTSLEVIIVEPAAFFVSNGRVLLQLLTRGRGISTPDGITLCQNMENLYLRSITGTPPNLVQILRTGLQHRKDNNLGLKTLAVHTYERIEGVETLSDLVENVSYSYGTFRGNDRNISLSSFSMAF